MDGSRFTEWRRMLWSKVEGRRILEVGVGSGDSYPFYPPTGTITAIDSSRKMLKRARRKIPEQDTRVNLILMDVQKIAFPSNSFDMAVCSMVLCSVKDPPQCLAEIKRVVRSGGKMVFLEHVISDNRAAALLMNGINPLLSVLVHENINRDTVYNVKRSGLIVDKVTRLSSIFRLIEAHKEMIYMPK